jgi:hypothetical protein
MNYYKGLEKNFVEIPEYENGHAFNLNKWEGQFHQ